MKLSQEQILALKITSCLIVFGLAVLLILPLMRHSDLWQSGQSFGKNKYIFLTLFAMGAYVFSYVLAKITLRPLRVANQKLREYNHHLAHELKTPLAVMSSNLELIQAGIDTEQTLESTMQELQSLNAIIESLLFLSENRMLLNQESYSCKELLDTLPVQMDFDLRGDGEFCGERDLLQRLLTNILENAHKYKTPGTRVKVEAEKHRLTISNQTQKIYSKTELSLLTQSFYRAYTGHEVSGYGLGLSLASKIAQLHHMSLEFRQNGDVFEVEIRQRS